MALPIAFFTIPPKSTPNSRRRRPLRKDSFDFLELLKPNPRRRVRRELTSAAAMFSDSVVVSDIIAEGLSGGVALSLLKLWEQTATRGVFDQVTLYTVIEAFVLGDALYYLRPGTSETFLFGIFRSGRQGALFAALIPGVNIIKMLLLGLGIWKDDATVKSMTRFGDHRELLKGPLYYACTITLASAIFWRTSPVAIAAVCNMCAGDGMADVVGRRFGGQKLPYNLNKSFIGSIAMVISGFLASLGFMFYYSSFGFMEESMKMVLGFLIVSIATALVESHPLSSELDDNLTVPVTAVLVGSLVF